MTRPDNRYRARDPRRGYAPPQPHFRKPRVASGVWVVVALAVTGLVGSWMLPRPAEAVTDADPLPPQKPLASLKAKDAQRQVALYGIEGGAKAQVAAASAVEPFDGSEENRVKPRVTLSPDRTEVVVKGVLSGNFHPHPAKNELADEDVRTEVRRLLVAQKLVPAKAGPDWPVEITARREVPPTSEQKAKWLGDDSLRDGAEDRGWLNADARVSLDALRVETANAHTAKAGFWFGTAFLVLLAGYGFLRLDMWTKGYLTLVLGLVVGAAAVGGVIALGFLVF